MVLIAPTEEYNHYYMRAALFVHAMGLDEYDDDEPVIRCVVLDNPTPFTMAEMSTSAATMTSSSAATTSPLLTRNLLYRGGNIGGETAMMLHSVKELGREEIASSGIYQGGLEQALQWVAAASADTALVDTVDTVDASSSSSSTSSTLHRQGRPEERFKFFFNYCQFSPDELESMLETTTVDGDAWMSVEVPPELVLAEWDKNECWRYLRKILRDQQEQEEEH